MHQVFRVVALAVCLGAGIARRVAFARPLLVFGEAAAVGAVAVGVVGEMGDGRVVRGDAGGAETGGACLALDATVATAAVSVVVNGVEVARVVDANEADALLLSPGTRQPGGERQAVRAVDDVAEVLRGFGGDRRVDFFC